MDNSGLICREAVYAGHGSPYILMVLLTGVLASAVQTTNAAGAGLAETGQRPSAEVLAEGTKREPPGKDVPSELERLLRERAITGGAVLHIGGQTVGVAEFLAGRGRFLTQVVTDSPTTLEAVRRGLRDRKLHGPASAYHLRDATLPYADSLARIIIVEDPLKLDPNEIRRVLAPGGSLLERSKEGWTTTVKPMPKSMDEWPCIDHDGGQSKASNDRLAGRPVNLRWQANSGMWGTEMPEQTTSLMLAADGRLVTIRPSQDRSSIWMAADCAWSGVLLWTTKLGSVPVSDPLYLGRFSRIKNRCPGLIADGKVWARGQAIDQATGEARFEFAGIPRLTWQNVVVSLKGPDDEPQVYATTGPDEGKPPPKVKVIATDAGTGRQLWTCAGTDAVGTSDTVFVLAQAKDGWTLEARDIKTGRVNWQRSMAQQMDIMGRQADAKAGVPKFDLTCTNRNVLVTPLARTLVTRTVLVYATADGTFQRAFRFHNAGGTSSLWREFCLAQADVAWCWVEGSDDVEFYTEGKGWDGRPATQPTTGPAGCRLVGIDIQKGRAIASHPIRSGIRLRCSPWAMAGDYAFFGDNSFMNLQDGTHAASGFFRLGCRIPYMPAYGMLYVPPSANCGCFNRLHGLMAMETSIDGGRKLFDVTDREYMQRGPAYGKVTRPANLADEALTLDKTLSAPALTQVVQRNSTALVNAARFSNPHGANPQTTEPGFTYMEDARGGRPDWLLTPISAVLPWVAADGRIVAVIPNEHGVVMLQGKDKPVSWEFTADARLVPGQRPHLVGDLCIFGGRDGWVYAVRSSDGALAWRNLAGPAERRFVAFEQFESPWPVVQNMVVHNGRLYAATGRHGLVPEVGWMVACFDIFTGKTLWKRRVPGKTSPEDKAELLLGFRTDDVTLDVQTHSVRSGFWHFDLDTGEVSTVFDKANVKTQEEWKKKFGEVYTALRRRPF